MTRFLAGLQSVCSYYEQCVGLTPPRPAQSCGLIQPSLKRHRQRNPGDLHLQERDS